MPFRVSARFTRPPRRKRAHRTGQGRRLDRECFVDRAPRGFPSAELKERMSPCSWPEMGHVFSLVHPEYSIRLVNKELTN